MFTILGAAQEFVVSCEEKEFATAEAACEAAIARSKTLLHLIKTVARYKPPEKEYPKKIAKALGDLLEAISAEELTVVVDKASWEAAEKVAKEKAK